MIFFSPCVSFSSILQGWKLDNDEGNMTWRQAKEEQRNKASMAKNERTTGAGNTEEKVKKHLIYDHLVRWQMEDGLGSFWRSVLRVINGVEGDRGTGQKAKVTEASRASWSKALHKFCSWNFLLQGWEVNSSMSPYLVNSSWFCQVKRIRSKTSKIRRKSPPQYFEMKLNWIHSKHLFLDAPIPCL